MESDVEMVDDMVSVKLEEFAADRLYQADPKVNNELSDILPDEVFREVFTAGRLLSNGPIAPAAAALAGGGALQPS